MISRTYIRTLSNVLFERFFAFYLLKRIVTFYYNTFIYHPNLFKNSQNMPINNIEHKNLLAMLKLSRSDIDYIY